MAERQSRIAETVREGKNEGEFFTGVRERGPSNDPEVERRGMLNSILAGPALAFQKQHPEQRCKWEYWPISGPLANDTSRVTTREAQGLHVVNATELSDQAPTEQTTGVIRRGDLVLMAGPKEILDALDESDRRAAEDDAKTPERTYKEAMSEKQYRTAGGEVRAGRPVGRITREVVDANLPIEEREGGE